MEVIGEEAVTMGAGGTVKVAVESHKSATF
jgi:hypothetical protein